METTRIKYVGPAPFAGEFAEVLANHGLTADYDPPFERKDLATAMAAVSVVFAVTGSLPDIVAATRAFKARHNDVQIQGLPEGPQRSIEQRLAELEQLRAESVVSDDEYRSQRTRILDEL